MRGAVPLSVAIPVAAVGAAAALGRETAVGLTDHPSMDRYAPTSDHGLPLLSSDSSQPITHPRGAHWIVCMGGGTVGGWTVGGSSKTRGWTVGGRSKTRGGTVGGRSKTRLETGT